MFNIFFRFIKNTSANRTQIDMGRGGGGGDWLYDNCIIYSYNNIILYIKEKKVHKYTTLAIAYKIID
jgi:hypothetical protein